MDAAGSTLSTRGLEGIAVRKAIFPVAAGILPAAFLFCAPAVEAFSACRCWTIPDGK
jgi:hypothetical protein